MAKKKREKWEDEKSEEDMERYFWDISKSRKTLVSLLQTIKSIDKVRNIAYLATCLF